MTHQFSYRRIYHFIRRDLTIRKSNISTALIVVSAILFIFFLINLREDYRISVGEFISVFGLFYIPLGVLLTFFICKESHDPKANHLYFVLPVSVYERMAAIWFTATILYTIVFSILSFLAGQFAILIGGVLFGTDFHLLPMLSGEYLGLVMFFCIIQPVFLVGALTFKKNRIGKTLLVFVLVFFGVIIYNLILFTMLNYRYDVHLGDTFASEAFGMAQNDFSLFGMLFFIGLFGPVMLFVAYCKMVEKEV
ncbi:hypothetical protein [uncultured Aquimarina sp.]|uniref:hypothetical protein n=1 Tax=uncultured Aquimarina sp. TaxID=575652 RepID=UPI00261607FF|nr:hypothetical protein [uncultured Aquimarina sp.]